VNIKLRPAVFLDRDGVINEEPVDYVKSLDEFHFLPGSLDAIRKLSQLGLPVIVITNQSGVGRGLMTMEILNEIHNWMLDEVHKAGGRIDGVFFCPHRPDEGCNCRKPKPGLILLATETFSLDLYRSYLIGDTEKDVLTALATGCQPILVKTGRGLKAVDSLKQKPDIQFHLAENLSEAVEWILEHMQAPQ